MSQNASNPRILLVHGACHTPRFFDTIIPHFDQQGYDTRAIQLPSVDVSPGLPDMSADVAAVRENVIQILDEEDRDAIILMHSYGSIPGTEALKGLSKKERGEAGKQTGVVALFYIAGGVPVLGGSSFTTCAQQSDEEKANPSALKFKDLGDGTIETENPIPSFYNDVEPKLAQEAVTWLRPHSIGVFMSPLTYAAYRHIPAAYLLCKNDQAITYPQQRRIVREAEIQITETIESDHSPFLTQPRAVVDFVQRSLMKMYPA